MKVGMARVAARALYLGLSVPFTGEQLELILMKHGGVLRDPRDPGMVIPVSYAMTENELRIRPDYAPEDKYLLVRLKRKQAKWLKKSLM